jgi:hypothetical protein
MQMFSVLVFISVILPSEKVCEGLFQAPETIFFLGLPL